MSDVELIDDDDDLPSAWEFLRGEVAEEFDQWTALGEAAHPMIRESAERLAAFDRPSWVTCKARDLAFVYWPDEIPDFDLVMFGWWPCIVYSDGRVTLDHVWLAGRGGRLPTEDGPLRLP